MSVSKSPVSIRFLYFSLKKDSSFENGLIPLTTNGGCCSIAKYLIND